MDVVAKDDSYLRGVARAVMARRGVAGRSVTVRDDDVFLTSYPKSGNTWLRFLVANLLWPDGTTDFSNIEVRVPDIYQTSDAELRRVTSPRALKSHEYFDPRYPRVIYVVRDVRSVLLSYFHHKVRTGEVAPDLPLVSFVRTFRDGHLDPFGSWRENVESWLQVRGDDTGRFLLLRYEDLKADGPASLRRVADFLDLKRDDGQIERACSLSSFDRMRSLEDRAGDRWIVNRKFRGGHFLRSGSTDEWRERLTPEAAVALEEAFGELRRRLGYGE